MSVFAPAFQWRCKVVVCFVIGACCMMATGVAAEDDDDWAPPDPSKAGWDWAQLDTGEWIKGEQLVLQDEEVIFDSDNFDEIDLDWEDIVELRLARSRTFRRLGRRTYVGMGELRDGIMRIRTRDGEVL